MYPGSFQVALALALVPDFFRQLSDVLPLGQGALLGSVARLGFMEPSCVTACLRSWCRLFNFRKPCSEAGYMRLHNMNQKFSVLKAA